MGLSFSMTCVISIEELIGMFGTVINVVQSVSFFFNSDDVFGNNQIVNSNVNYTSTGVAEWLRMSTSAKAFQDRVPP